MKMLVAQPLFLGDLVLTTPLLQHLKQAFPRDSIDLLVVERLEDVVRSHPAVTSVLSYDREGEDHGWLGMARLSSRLRSGRYSVALVLPGSVRTALAVYFAGIPRRIGTNMSSGLLLFEQMVKFPEEMKKSPHARSVLCAEKVWRRMGGKRSFICPFFTDVVLLDARLNAIQRYLQLLEPFGVPIQEDLSAPRIFPRPPDQAQVDKMLGGCTRDSMIGIAPGSLWKTKRWPDTLFAELTRRLLDEGHAVVVVGGEADAEPCRQILRTVQSPNLITTCAQLSPLQSAELIRRCRLLISNDSAPMHLASAMGTMCIALFGPTSPAFGFVPASNRTIVIERPSLACRPCTPHGGDECPIGTHECMTGISVDEVHLHVNRLLKRNDRGTASDESSDY